MIIKVGTFNLNNLFSRFNFSAAVSAIQEGGGGITVRYEFTEEDNFRLRTYRGSLVKAKKSADTEKVVERIIDMDLDVVAVQEVENIDILKEFNLDNLNGLYKHTVLIEGNDPRLIDVGVLSS
jgi:predicted extracellular nuclease